MTRTQPRRYATGWFAAIPVAASISLCSVALSAQTAAARPARPGIPPSEADVDHAAPAGGLIVHPQFGGQILGYDIDPGGTEGLLSEYVDLPNGTVLAATETFDQSTGKIIKVVAQTQTQDDFVTLGVFGKLGLVLHQHAGQNRFPVLKPLDSNRFNARWTPPIMPGYRLWSISAGQGGANVAAIQSSDPNSEISSVFRSNLAQNSFGPQISLAPINSHGLFYQPLIALDTNTREAVLADSLGCPEPVCVTTIALVNLGTGNIRTFSAGLGIGGVDGLAVDPSTGIAVTTTLIDQGVEFYDLDNETGFEVQIPNAGNALQAGLDVAFDRPQKVFLVEQYSSTGNPNDPQPRVYVYDESGNVTDTITGLQRLPVSPSSVQLRRRRRINAGRLRAEDQGSFRWPKARPREGDGVRRPEGPAGANGGSARGMSSRVVCPQVKAGVGCSKRAILKNQGQSAGWIT